MNEPWNSVEPVAVACLKALGADPSLIAPGLYRVELSADQQMALEGRTITSPWLRGPRRSEKVVLYWAFHPEALRLQPDAELVTGGSDRLRQLELLARQRGALAQATWFPSSARSNRQHPGLAPDSNTFEAAEADSINLSLVYRRHLFVVVSGDCYPGPPRRQLYAVLVDLLQATCYWLGPTQAARVARWKLSPDPPDQVQIGKVDLTEAWQTILCCLEQVLAQHEPPTWAQEANALMCKEKAILEDYYSRRAKETRASLDAECQRRLAELYRRLEPRLIVRPVLVARLYIPVWVNRHTPEGEPVRHPFLEEWGPIPKQWLPDGPLLPHGITTAPPTADHVATSTNGGDQSC